MQVNLRHPDAAEEKRKLLCLEQLTQDRMQLLLKWPFIGGIIMRMELIAVRDDRLGTASTDGSRIFVDINFYGKLNRNERLFVLAHEVWHSVLLHLERRQNRDQDLFNQAADLEIHFTLKEEKMAEPWVLPHDKRWEGLSAEEIYERLPAFLQQQPPAAGFDKHLYTGDKVESPEDAAGKKQSGASAAGEGETGGETQTLTIDAEYAPLISSDVAERVRGRVVASSQQMERMHGSLPGHLARLVERLLKPSLPWQEMLKQFVTACYGGQRRWCPPSRRYVWQELYLPSMRSERLRAVVALDTSGSTQGDMQRFFSELFSLMKTFGSFELTVIHCDVMVQHVESFTDAALPGPNYQWQMYGAGGTDFRPVFRYVAEKELKPELLIFFTDGDGPAPEKAPDYPVMWVLTRNHVNPCDWGRKTFFRD